MIPLPLNPRQILLDAWQLFTTILNPEMGWAINTDGLGWKAVSVLSFGWLADLVRYRVSCVLEETGVDGAHRRGECA